MIKQLFTHPTDSTLIQLFRYTFVGGIAFIVDFTLLFLLTDIFGLYYLVSAAIAFLLGLATNYALSISWVFRRRTLNNRGYEFVVFALIGIVGLGFNELFIWFFTESIHLHYLESKIVSTIFVYSWNFFARKFILFR